MSTFVIFNPDNDLMWSRTEGRFVAERDGRYTRYATRANAEAALRRTRSMRGRGFVVVSDPAHERSLKLEELGLQSPGRW
jgi:hypothetical protein